MKIVVLDGYTENPGDLSWEGIEKQGDLIVYDRTDVNSDKLIIERIKGAEAVFTNKTPINSEIIDASPDLKYICILATGYNIVDVDHAKTNNILVANIPSYGTEAVSQFAIALLLEICHHVGHHDRAVHDGKWSNSPDWCFWDYPLIELSNKTMGIIGFGRIGQATGRIAKSLNMEVIAYDSYENDKGRSIGEYVSLDDLYAKSDVIVLHCPLTPETEKLVNKNTLNRMKDGIIIINNSRGQLVNEYDLADALKNGKVKAAGLDVVSSEPIDPSNPLLNAPNCFITPHISWAAKESRQRLMDIAVENLSSYIHKNPQNIVSR